ncbi:MAG: FMN-binding glutamate synthase family protein [Maricaulaceae bacterium]
MLAFYIQDMGDTMGMLTSFALRGLNILGSLVLILFGTLIILGTVFFILDVRQEEDAVRRNYPVIGRFRHLFSELGEFFRQYFFAMDREEMPFNRAERDYINDVCDDGHETVPFGSTKALTAGTSIFANGLFPKLEGEHNPQKPFVIGPDARQPYEPNSFFNISAMSYGSLSKPAIRALSNGAQLAGCWLNTGEGGVSPYHLEGNCDIVFQIGTAKFGARNDDATLNEHKLKAICENPNIKMVEIKLSQGAKPGKGGILPASKVTAEIAEIRGIPEGQAAISPNRHIDASNPAQLLDLIHKCREISGRPVGIKFVIGNTAPVRELMAEIKSRGLAYAPDYIALDGGDGGTGAAPLPLIDNMGLSIRESLPILDDMLIEFGLRDHIAVIASGKLITPAEIAWAFCAGANFVSSARGFMFALGCIQALKCDQNTCPTGITTHNKRLQGGLDPENKAVRVMRYVSTVRKEVEMIAHSCGVDHPRQLTRDHVMIVQTNGHAIPLSDVWAQKAATDG